MATKQQLEKYWSNYKTLDPDSLAAAIEDKISQIKASLPAIFEKKATYSDALVPFIIDSYALDVMFGEYGHMHSMDSDRWRKHYGPLVEKLTAFSAELGQNTDLYNLYNKISETDLTQAQQAVVKQALRDFRLQGVSLPAEKRAAFKNELEALSKANTDFEHNLLDATMAWHMTTKSTDGLPESFVELARSKAQEKGLEGILIGLDSPSVQTVLTYAKDRELRQKLYEAYQTRASEIGPDAGKFDNSEVMVRIMKHRARLAELLGMPHYGAYSLESKMASNVAEVEEFLLKLAKSAKPIAQQQLQAMKDKAKELGFELRGWDHAFVAELLQQEQYSLNQEELRKYFPYTKVFNGLAGKIDELFGVKFVKIETDTLWCDKAHAYELHKGSEVIGYLLVDMIARPHKQEGAWMNDLRRRAAMNGFKDLPVVYLVCNYRAPLPGQDTLLTHDDVVTLFHEMGHSLHNLLTHIEEVDVAGICGVEWDAVECPSQWLENFAFEPAVLKEISEHVETKEPLPDADINNIIAAKNFNAGLFILRQVEFALFDIRLHSRQINSIEDIYSILKDVRKEVAVVKAEEFNRFANTFGHIFKGGYAAGYYSYLWAEVLAADIYSEFKAKGSKAGPEFLNKYLGQGSVKPSSELFADFMGRAPDGNALLASYGLV